MGVSYKNFWALNADEAVATGLLRDYFKDAVGVFMPLDAQFKDIDLVLLNLKNKKSLTVQVKGSRAYEPKASEKNRFGYGSAGWFFLKKETILQCKADYFIFLVYVLRDDIDKGRRYTEPHMITIQTKELQRLCKKKKILHTRYCFFIWIDPKSRRAFDWRDENKKGIIYLEKHLDQKGLQRLQKELK